MVHALAGTCGDNGGLTHAHAEPGVAVEQDHVQKEDHAGFEDLRIATPEHWPVHPRRWVHGPHGIAASGQSGIAVAGVVQCVLMDIVDLTHSATGTQRLLTRLQGIGAGLVHVSVARVGLTGDNRVYHAGVIVPVGCAWLEHDLIGVADNVVAGVIATEERCLASTNGPATRWRISTSRHECLHHGAIDGLHGSPGNARVDTHGQDPVAEYAGLAHVCQFGLAFYQPQDPDEIRGVDQATKAMQRGINHFRPLPGEAIGVVLDPKALTPAAVILEQRSQVIARCRLFSVIPDADVLDYRSRMRLDTIGRARQQGAATIYSQVHGLEHGVTTRVVAGQVIHALLSKQDETIEARFRYLQASRLLALLELFPAEMQRWHRFSPWRSAA